MNPIRSLFFLSAATVAANGVQAFVAPSPRVIEPASATQLQAFGGFGTKQKPTKVTGLGAPGFNPGPAPGNKVAVKQAKRGFSFGGGAAKKSVASAPAPVSSGSKGIVRGFSKQWNPTVPKTGDEGGIKRGFSKAWNPR